MFRESLVAAVLLIPASALAASPHHFMKDAIEGDYSEMTLGKYIEQHGGSAQVRQFGTTLASDHQKGLGQAQDLAKRLHMTIAPSLTPQARNELTKLQHLHGPAFDREVKRYMVHDHEKDLAEFKQQAKSGDRATSGFAAATIPVLQKHLGIARSIRG